MKPNSSQERNTIRATTPVIPATWTQWVTGMETGSIKNAPHVKIMVITQETVWQREEKQMYKKYILQHHMLHSPWLEYTKIPKPLPHTPFTTYT